jgi:hypothetical protein
MCLPPTAHKYLLPFCCPHLKEISLCCLVGVYSTVYRWVLLLCLCKMAVLSLLDDQSFTWSTDYVKFRQFSGRTEENQEEISGETVPRQSLYATRPQFSLYTRLLGRWRCAVNLCASTARSANRQLLFAQHQLYCDGHTTVLYRLVCRHMVR